MGYVCVHGHFYQPPRENPWLEAIELQESAYPYHDWNERINAECYSPNAASRILDHEKRIVRIVNNYSNISFDFGPTLLSWIEPNDPAVYKAIVEADLESRKRHSGHGSALAQPYNHMIMPLANRRDRFTQAIWGVRDFEHRFGRRPEGMWLPEAAADLPTLETLAQLGIQFTVLAPNQASRVRKLSERKWTNVSGGRIDPTRLSLLRLPSGRSIRVFFYDGPISRAVAFEGLLDNGEYFAKRLLSAFPSANAEKRLVHIATDGETYGHHHRYGEMALSYALNYIETNRLARLTNYAEYLEQHRPERVVEIFENSSWSCAHGVERWRSNCGCNSGGHPGWNQEWRAPLRQALDWLRDTLAPLYQKTAGKFLKDPWKARDEYIDVILDRSERSRESFLARHAARELNEEQKVVVWKLLELQRHAMLMYTSCGWFFDELSGIETVQVIQYAGRALQLAEELTEDSLEARFVEMLGKAKSNIPEHRDGARIYEKFVKPAFVDLRKLGAHYSIRSLFEPYEEQTHIYSYQVERQAGTTLTKGDKHGPKLAVGRAQFTSEVTRESGVLEFAAFGTGDFNPVGGILKADGTAAYDPLAHSLGDAFSNGDFDEVSRLLEENFEDGTYRLNVLFRDEQHNILNRIIESEWTEAETAFEKLYPHVISIIQTLVKTGAPPMVPRVFYAVAEFALNTRLRRAFLSDQMDFDEIHTLIQDAEAAGVALDAKTLEYTLQTRLEGMAARFRADLNNPDLLKTLDATVGLARSLPLEVNLWKIQNLCYKLLQTFYRKFQQKALQGDASAKMWADHFDALARKLSLRVT